MKLATLPLAVLVVLATAWGATAVGAAGLVPVEDFARTPAFSHVRLSPDGTAVAYLAEHHGLTKLFVLDLERQRGARFEPGPAPAFGTSVPKEVAGFQWLSPRRLFYTTTVWERLYGVAAVNRDGTQAVGIGGYEMDRTGQFAIFATEAIHAFRDDAESVLLLDRRDTAGAQRLHPDVIRVGTLDGTITRVARNPGNVVGWCADGAGRVRIGITLDGLKSGVIYRDSDEAPWRELVPPAPGRGGWSALAFDQTRDRLLVAGRSDGGRRAVFPLDPKSGEVGEPLLADPEYDVVMERGNPSIDGIELQRPVFSEARQELLGMWYVADAPRVRWFNREWQTFQAGVDRALSDTVNLVVDVSDDDRKVLVFAFADRDPGRYVLFDRIAHSIRPIAECRPWLRREDLSPMHALEFTARDGVVIHGYVTIPAGRDPRHLPLVVMPHGGPRVRDVWGFDPLVQLCASRGYAVLQMNYRGSPGYGDAFYNLGRRAVGRGMQDDIEDATRWAIASGLADPERIAIVGGSYGGYSALFALGHNPELYRCGISIAGVTDWLAIYRDGLRGEEYKYARLFWEREIGDPEQDEEFLAAISPVNFADRITAPLLIIQGKEDRTVPARQATSMVDALARAGRKPETLFLGATGHNLGNQKTRTEAMQRIEAFLAGHLGPGAPVVAGE